uniref:Uncharacterized protein n=1 Tax=Romanomermis culicivorax TaxID=13658 RepID=A0A915IV10_ROMCU
MDDKAMSQPMPSAQAGTLTPLDKEICENRAQSKSIKAAPRELPSATRAPKANPVRFPTAKAALKLVHFSYSDRHCTVFQAFWHLVHGNVNEW